MFLREAPYASALIVFIVVLLYGVLHSILASNQAKKLARTWGGEYAQRIFRLFYNLLATVTLLPVLALPAVLPDQLLYKIPYPWTLLSSAMQLLALLALAAGVLQTGLWSFLGVRQLVVGAEDKPAQLVVSGLYSRMRHPLYTAGLVFIWLIPRMSVNFLALNLGLSLYLIVGAMVEERKLVTEYGDAYVRYREQTPMFLPGL
ncbi:MAG: isoprenylcysteine carboxylmethyltransferase family protein [Anaerolineales bacterium]